MTDIPMINEDTLRSAMAKIDTELQLLAVERLDESMKAHIAHPSAELAATVEIYAHLTTFTCTYDKSGCLPYMWGRIVDELMLSSHPRVKLGFGTFKLSYYAEDNK